MSSKLEILISVIDDALSLNGQPIEESDTFLGLGGDSLAAMYVVEGLKERGFVIDPTDLFDDIALEKVALGLVVSR